MSSNITMSTNCYKVPGPWLKANKGTKISDKRNVQKPANNYESLSTSSYYKAKTILQPSCLPLIN